MQRVYFDNAATTPILPEVIEAMTEAMRTDFGNPSSIHAEGRQVRALIERARKTVANAIGASIGEVFFTSGGTESNNMALKCAVRDLNVRRIISSPLEHHCVLHSLDALQLKGIEIAHVRVNGRGEVDYEHLRELLSIPSPNGRTLVSLMHANNEIGALLDLDRVAKMCQEYGAYLHSDTVQTVGHFPIDVNETPISFLSGAAHKFHGPKGVGFVYINGDNIIKPYLDGGAQERNMRAGTENVYGIIGMAKALELATENMDAHRAHIESLRTYLMDELETTVPGVRFNGPGRDGGLYTVLSVNFPPSEGSELLLLNLDIYGISASGGSACSSGADKGSHVLQALGADPERPSVRFSFSHLNTRADVDFLLDKLVLILEVERRPTVVVNDTI